MCLGLGWLRLGNCGGAWCCLVFRICYWVSIRKDGVFGVRKEQVSLSSQDSRILCFYQEEGTLLVLVMECDSRESSIYLL